MTTVTHHQQRGVQIWIIAAVAIGFGLLTIKQGGTVLFGSDASRAAAGNYVPAVLWFNFLAGFAYVIAGVGLWLHQRWAVWLAVAIAVATALTFTAFGVYIFFGLAYEERTVMAMGLRTLVWAVIAAVVWRSVAYRRV
ncbi:MAG: hypothetical protein RIR09_3050 [Pseudomonadota bacterium]